MSLALDVVLHPSATHVNTASGNAAEKNGAQSLSTPRYENRRSISQNASPSIVPAKMRNPTPPWRRWNCANGSASIIITSTATG